VDFDLDIGPVIDGIYPPLHLSSDEAENIAFSAFPDSSQFEQGFQIHSFRIRETVSPDKPPISPEGFIYAFSYFSQRKYTQSKRGYQQRSVVILTHLQYPVLFTQVLGICGHLYEEHGAIMLETACHNIATWPDPYGGTAAELGFMGSVILVDLPRTPDEQQLISRNPEYILASAASLSPPPLELFEACLPHLWSIWECLVLCEPILVFGASPSQTSQAVWWLRDLIRPIPLAGDFRPYFTIHDSDHLLLVNNLPPKAGTLVGVTNPFFERASAHWPHVLSLGPSRTNASASASGHSYGGIKTTTAGPVPGWRTRTHRRFVSKDRSLLKRLEETARTGDERAKIQISLELRRHFCTRTTEVLVPLSRYFGTLIPTPAEIAQSTCPLRIKPFNSEHFFSSLKAHGTTLPFRSTSRRKGFYQKWLKTPAFGLWLTHQENIVQDVL
ncbi:DUF1630-domain-containing protein, partial [Fistulina hepatica ATCC 64428]